MKNKKATSEFFLVLLLLAGFFGFGEKLLAACTDLVVNEVMTLPLSSSTQFVKIKNASPEELLFKKGSTYISELRLNTDGANHYISIVPEISSIAPNEFFILTNSKDFFALRVLHNLASDIKILHSTFSLKEDGFVQLSCDSGKTFFSKFIFEKKEVPPPEPKAYSSQIFYNELLPNPSGTDTAGEFIEFYNSSEKTENLENWKLKDAKGVLHPLKKIDGISLEIAPKKYLVINPNKYGVSLHNTVDETIDLLDPDDKKVDSVSYQHSEVKENIAYAFDGIEWHWSNKLTPGEKNKFNASPKVRSKKDDKIYVGMYADFSARGTDEDGDKLKYVWDFDDGHKSYLKETRHKFEKKGAYTITLKISDGTEDRIETFKIKVEKFPESKVKIIALSPNPKGKDSDAEFLTVQNKSKKKINLKNWRLATGSKKLYNHPITEDLWIAPGEILKITREFSNFSLHNKNCKVELRYPNGKVASHLAYAKKKKSVSEDEIYSKASGQWAWVAPKAETKLAAALPTAVAKPQLEIIPTKKIALRKLKIQTLSENSGQVAGAEETKKTEPSKKTKVAFVSLLFTQINSSFNRLFLLIF